MDLGDTHVNEQEGGGTIVHPLAVLDFLPERTITGGRVGDVKRSLIWCNTRRSAYDTMQGIEVVVDPNIRFQYAGPHKHR